jgi:hypothetical protein
VAERCLNHVLPGMARIYDQGDYLDTWKAALQAWADHLRKIVAANDGKAVA